MFVSLVSSTPVGVVVPVVPVVPVVGITQVVPVSVPVGVLAAQGTPVGVTQVVHVESVVVLTGCTPLFSYRALPCSKFPCCLRRFLSDSVACALVDPEATSFLNCALSVS